MVLKELESMSRRVRINGEPRCMCSKSSLSTISRTRRNKVFKSAEKALGHDEIQNIMKQFELAKQKIKKSLK